MVVISKRKIKKRSLIKGVPKKAVVISKK